MARTQNASSMTTRKSKRTKNKGKASSPVRLDSDASVFSSYHNSSISISLKFSVKRMTTVGECVESSKRVKFDNEITFIDRRTFWGIPYQDIFQSLKEAGAGTGTGAIV
ncbi:hypothetical protein RND71_005297 [Anisodus tanguticus]|uniref:Uncharacterized protein n=1 Tax=Anisodus tanguticus TaxID=243964 RepID=A0AAE1VVE1_9SOLA|nr:hypothetical protein RND71_005297 [Anisodus tanguticus]